MTNTPPRVALEAIVTGISRITRRLEFYEHDGQTRWYPDKDEHSRFVDGSISVDYERDERRTIDVTLLNDDRALDPDPYEGLWYDKVIKTYRGVEYKDNLEPPRMVIIEEFLTNAAYDLRTTLVNLGYTRVDIDFSITAYEDLADYDVIISHMQNNLTLKAGLLQTAYNAGKCIITTGNDNTQTQLPFVISSTSAGIVTWNITPVNGDVPLVKNWASETNGTNAGMNLIVDDTAIVIANMLSGTTTIPTAIIASNQSDGKWFHYLPTAINTQANKLWSAAIDWLVPNGELKQWETQTGEFVIDNIDQDNFPYQVKVVGRDYTKRCLNSKITKAIAFEAGTPIRDLIISLAANSNIYKMQIPNITKKLPTRLDYAAETPRWQIMKELANSANSDIFFDSQGYLTTQRYQDPAFSSVVITLKTGSDGNLVKFTKSTNDSELYNHIVITSDTEGEDGAIPFFGEARNTEPSSPTNVNRIDERVFFWSSVAMESDKACRDLARSWMKIKALESYDFNFNSIVFSWLDVGNIVEILDPDRSANDPTRYLLSTIDFPFALGPMGGTAKRVTFVSDENLEEEDDA